MVLAQAPNGNFRRKPGRTSNRATTTESPQPTDDGESSDCPEPYGYFADAEQCDKYYACKWVDAVYIANKITTIFVCFSIKTINLKLWLFAVMVW